MRDPELVARAERGARRLESAWENWRAQHGLATAPGQPIVSYVGYSLTEPWGEPRVVIGIDADEAEYLADFLDRDDGAHRTASATAGSPGRTTARNTVVSTPGRRCWPRRSTSASAAMRRIRSATWPPNWPVAPTVSLPARVTEELAAVLLGLADGLDQPPATAIARPRRPGPHPLPRWFEGVHSCVLASVKVLAA